MGRRREDSEPYDPYGGTRDLPPVTGGAYPPRPAYEQPSEPPSSGRGWMVAFFVLVLAIVAGALFWYFALRDEGGGDLEIAPASVDFGDQDLGTRSGVEAILIRNGTSDALRIGSVEIEGEHPRDFQLTDETTCSAESPLEADAACTVGVRFRPRARGERSAALVVRIAGREAPLRVSLHGTGVGQAAVVLEATTLDLGQVLIGRSRTRDVALTNAGNAPLAIAELTISGRDARDFRISGRTDCSAEDRLRPGATCTLAVTFRPRGDGARRAELVIVHDAEGSPSGVQLRGAGRGQPALAVEPEALDFGELTVGEASEVETVTIANGGTAAFTLRSLELTGSAAGDFELAGTSTCSAGLELAPGDECSADLVFTPAEEGARTAALEVVTGAGQAVRVDLSGEGLPPPGATTG